MYDEDFHPGVFFSSTEVNDMALTLRLNPEFTSLAPNTVRPACAPNVTGVLYRSKFSFPDICGYAVVVVVVGGGCVGLWIMGEGVRCCLRRDFMYSDSNWNSSEGGEGGSSSWRERRAEERAWRAVISNSCGCYSDIVFAGGLRLFLMVGDRGWIFDLCGNGVCLCVIVSS